MPPKRRAPAQPTEPKKKRSALAKEHNITAQQESEIQEAYSLFAVQSEDSDSPHGVLRTEDIRRCLIALGITPASQDLPGIIKVLDPTSTGFTEYEYVVGVAAALLNARDDDPDRENEEIEKAFELFTKGSSVITLAHLKRVAKELKEDVSEDVLRDMILEANGGIGKDGVNQGVGLEDFEGVMRRAGVFS